MARLACLLLGALTALACSSPNPGGAVASSAQALGKADSGDSADRACQVVLRSVGRGPGDDGYETDGEGPSRPYLWRGVIDVADEVPAEATVHVLYHRASDPTWWEIEASPDLGVVYGYRRYAFALSHQLFGPGEPEEPFQLVAFVRDPDGGRLFDHNRFPGDFDNLTLDGGNGFSANDGGVCQPVVGTLSFNGDWSEGTSGVRRQGGWLEVRYDLDRLPQCRGTHNGYPAWDVVAYVKFLPGGQLLSGSVRELVTSHGTPTGQATGKPFAVRIPADAESVQLWFHNFTGAGSSCAAWDSNLDANYAFDVWPEADDPRCQGVVKARDLHAESDQMVMNEPWCLGYDVAEDADATHCELRVEGFGDGHLGHYGIPFDWYVAYLRAGATDGQVLNAGLWARVHDNLGGADADVFALGRSLGEGLFRAGLPHRITGFQSLPAADVRLDAFAFFVDVRRADGHVVRLWVSRGGENYTLADAFGPGASTESIPYGHVDWARADAGVLESMRACD